MRRKNNGPALLLSMTILILQMGCSGTVEKKDSYALAGMYKLQSIEELDSAGNWQDDHWSKGGESYILYDGLGHMAVHISPKGYKDFQWMDEERAINVNMVKEKLDTMTIEQLKAALTEFSSSYVYVANYTIDDSTNIITHNRITSSIPAIWGTSVKREFRFSGDTLILKNPTINRRLVWLRQP